MTNYCQNNSLAAAEQKQNPNVWQIFFKVSQANITESHSEVNLFVTKSSVILQDQSMFLGSNYPTGNCLPYIVYYLIRISVSYSYFHNGNVDLSDNYLIWKYTFIFKILILHFMLCDTIGYIYILSTKSQFCYLNKLGEQKNYNIVCWQELYARCLVTMSCWSINICFWIQPPHF